MVVNGFPSSCLCILKALISLFWSDSPQINILNIPCEFNFIAFPGTLFMHLHLCLFCLHLVMKISPIFNLFFSLLMLCFSTSWSSQWVDEIDLCFIWYPFICLWITLVPLSFPWKLLHIWRCLLLNSTKFNSIFKNCPYINKGMKKIKEDWN